MRILITTPLYPPDIAPSARYVKELAKRLTGEYKVTILAYGHLPEKIDGVEIMAVNKRQPMFLRLLKYITALFKAMPGTDIVYTENGPSVELPLAIVGVFIRKPIILHIGDKKANLHLKTKSGFKFIRNFLSKRVREIVTVIPKQKPEILPFEETPVDKIKEYEASWENHVSKLKNTFQKYGK